MYTLYLIAIGAFPISNFDGALQLLSQIYTSNGYIPYQDFGVVYPPWHFILVGNLFPFISFSSRNVLYAISYGLLIMTGYSVLITYIVQKKDKYIASTIFFFINAIILRVFGATNAFAILTFMVVCISSFAYTVTQNKKLLWVLFTFSALIVLMRWDWITVLCIGDVGSCVLLVLLNWWKKGEFKKWTTTQLKMTGAIVSGYAFGVLVLFVYLDRLHVTKEAIDFFVTIPISVIGPYRKLPMPGFVSPLDGNSLLYICLLLIGAIGFETYQLWGKRSKSERYKMLYLLGNMALFLLPVFSYSLRRPTLSFFLPIFYILGMVWIFFHTHFKRNVIWFLLFFVTILPIPIRGWYLLDMKIYNPVPNVMTDEMNVKSSDCIDIAKEIPATTMFVGRRSYEQFWVSNPSLYLQFLHLKPASSYISDEPGLQNSCEYGKKIADELAKAEKPMLTFLDFNDQKPDSPAIHAMTSCKMIEEYLYSSDYTEIGRCTSYDTEYMVRVYH
jgi:hypothetical protein